MVDIEVNGNPVEVHMKLGESGDAFFVSESPIPSNIDTLMGKRDENMLPT